MNKNNSIFTSSYNTSLIKREFRWANTLSLGIMLFNDQVSVWEIYV